MAKIWFERPSVARVISRRGVMKAVRLVLHWATHRSRSQSKKIDGNAQHLCQTNVTDHFNFFFNLDENFHLSGMECDWNCCTIRSVVQQPNNMSESLDSILGKALSDSSVRSAQDALVVALHACLLSGGFVCVALGDEVIALDGC